MHVLDSMDVLFRKYHGRFVVFAKEGSLVIVKCILVKRMRTAVFNNILYHLEHV